MLALLTGCASSAYEASPLDPVQVLRDLRATGTALPGGTDATGQDGEQLAALTMEQAAALAVERNPTLRAMRAEIGVSQAKLVEAGLLPDPSIGWDAMDVLTNQWVNGNTDQEDWVGGFGLSWRVPRPGELSALEAVAGAELERTEWAVVRAEWGLAQAVADAWIELASVRGRLGVANELLVLGRRTASTLEQARRVRAATGIEANLAALDVADLELERLGLEDEEILDRQALNALLGLAPDTRYEIATADVMSTGPDTAPDPAAIMDAAIVQRPDLAELMTDYAAAEAALLLEVVKQFPELSIGTGIEVVLPMFSRANCYAIRRAYAEREVIRRVVTAEVARLRAEVHATVAAYRRARRQADYIAENVEPRLEESLRLTEASIAARELSTLEVLLTQRQILDARMRALAARFEAASSWVRVQAVSGRLFGTGARHVPDAATEAEEDE